MAATHEDCGNGHQKPIGQNCAICAADRKGAKIDRQLDKNDKALAKIKETQEKQKKDGKK